VTGRDSADKQVTPTDQKGFWGRYAENYQRRRNISRETRPNWRHALLALAGFAMIWVVVILMMRVIVMVIPSVVRWLPDPVRWLPSILLVLMMVWTMFVLSLSLLPKSKRQGEPWSIDWRGFWLMLAGSVPISLVLMALGCPPTTIACLIMGWMMGVVSYRTLPRA
jgi:cytochrome c biogenesis protein CcdA